MEERGHPLVDLTGGGGYMASQMACHSKMEESKQVRDDLSTKQALKLH